MHFLGIAMLPVLVTLTVSAAPGPSVKCKRDLMVCEDPNSIAVCMSQWPLKNCSCNEGKLECEFDQGYCTAHCYCKADATGGC